MKMPLLRYQPHHRHARDTTALESKAAPHHVYRSVSGKPKRPELEVLVELGVKLRSLRRATPFITRTFEKVEDVMRTLPRGYDWSPSNQSGVYRKLFDVSGPSGRTYRVSVSLHNDGHAGVVNNRVEIEYTTPRPNERVHFAGYAENPRSMVSYSLKPQSVHHDRPEWVRLTIPCRVADPLDVAIQRCMTEPRVLYQS